MSILAWLGWVTLAILSGVAAWLLARVLTKTTIRTTSHTDLWILTGLVVFCTGYGLALAWKTITFMHGLGMVVVTTILIAICLIDFWTRRIPDILNLALLAWGLVQMTWLKTPNFASSGIGLLVSGGLFLLLALIGRGAMGLGDVKLAAVLGALLGFPLVLVALVVCVLSGGIAAIGLVIAGRGKRGSTMAYGPYLALGGWVAALGATLGFWLGFTSG